jgi:hypothetical protein
MIHTTFDSICAAALMCAPFAFALLSKAAAIIA